MSIADPYWDHILVDAETFLTEAVNLRVQMRQEESSFISILCASYNRDVSFLQPIVVELWNRNGCSSRVVLDCMDRLAIQRSCAEREIASFRRKWGMPPAHATLEPLPRLSDLGLDIDRRTAHESVTAKPKPKKKKAVANA